MLNQSGFDRWAEDYDESVALSDGEERYPFAGYKKLLDRICALVLQKERPRVLDLGFGTGVLTARLYEAGCRIFGQDFSPRMIELAKEKMPEAVLVQGDFSEGLAPALREKQYDFILSTYALHHLDLAGKIGLIRRLRGCLAPGGQLLIGDVAFCTEADLARCREAAGEEWDPEESYFVYTEMKAAFPAMEFEAISHCAGLLRLRAPAAPEAGVLELHIPQPEDGWFYVRMLSDPATMSYNAPWFPPDGCIPNAEAEWEDMQRDWIGKEPKRFYAFLRRVSDGAFVGDVNFHYNPERGWWDMGIVIYAPERGKGYGKQGLRLLLDRAFRVAGVSRLHNEFESVRDAGWRIHKAAGFRELGVENGMVQLEMRREDYLFDC